MLTETVKKFISGTAGIDASEEALAYYGLPNGQYADYKFEGIQVPKYFESIASVKLYYKREHGGNLYLRFKTSHVDVSDLPKSSTTDSDNYTAYAGGGIDGKYASITVPSGVYDGLTTIEDFDSLAFKVERDASHASDTYEAEFKISFIEVVFNVEAAASGANDIVTLSELKSYLRKTDTAQDNFLQDWITIVSGQIERYCGRKFRVQTVTETLDGDGSNTLYTTYFPVTALAGDTDSEKLSNLQYRNTPDDAWTNIETNINHIFIDSKTPYIELYDTYFPEGRLNIRVSYKPGYSTIPEDVKRVACEMVAMVWKESNAGGYFRLGESSTTESVAGTNFTRNFIDLDKRWKAILDSYRVLAVTSLGVSR